MPLFCVYRDTMVPTCNFLCSSSANTTSIGGWYNFRKSEKRQSMCPREYFSKSEKCIFILDNYHVSILPKFRLSGHKAKLLSHVTSQDTHMIKNPHESGSGQPLPGVDERIEEYPFSIVSCLCYLQ